MKWSFVFLALVLSACSSPTENPGLADALVSDTGTPGKATLAVSCTVPTPCGGDPRGSWVLVTGCGRAPDDCNPTGSSVTIKSGGVEFDVESKTSRDRMTWTVSLDSNYCRGSELASENEQGFYSIVGTSLAVEYLHIGVAKSTLPFCVTGDELWIAEPSAVFPHLAVRYYKRK